MNGEIYQAILKAALPLGLFSFLMFWLSLKSSKLRERQDSSAFEAAVTGKQPAAPQKKVRLRNPLQKKWMKFGGGFYGLVGLWTFLLIEGREVYGFVTGYEGMDAVMETLRASSGAELAVAFFKNQLQNFITAVTWPVYWPDVLQSERIWLWAVAAYGGYWIGMKTARIRAR